MTRPRSAPRYTGVRTFAGLDHVAPAGTGSPWGQEVRAAVIGAPFDTTTSWRPGARFGPEGIRAASTLLRPWHPAHALDVFASLGLLDGGDAALTPGNAQRSAEQLKDALTPLYAGGVVPLVLGGDHSVLLGELRAHAGVHGPVGLVALDAHADTWEDYYGERYFHGTVLVRALEEGLIDPARSIIAGVRGSLYAPTDLDDARALGFELLPIEELRALTPGEFASRVRERTAGGSVHLSFDIDVVDPSAAPGTGTPEVGGLLSGEVLALLRALAPQRFAGFDVVEVSPPYDSAGQITCLLAANVAYELLALAAAAAADSSRG